MRRSTVRLSNLDFMHAPGHPVAARWLLALGALCLSGSMALAHHWRIQRDAAAQDEQAALERLNEALAPAVPPPPRALKRGEAQVRLQLNQPWMAALGAIEVTTHEPVYLLSMSIEPRTGTLRLEGEAPAFDQALGYVTALGSQPALASAALESHSQAPGNPSAVRFSATAHWRTP